MRRLALAIAISFAAATAASAGKFVGDLVLEPEGCEKQLECTLKNDFGFVDDKGIGWQAAAGLKTDGASIPDWAQPYVGGQFDKDFIRAAVIHDHYCVRHVRPWEQTHEVFYEGLIAGGVSQAKADLMYYAVYLGGPKWTELIKGQPCPVGKSCIRRVEHQSWGPGLQVGRNEESKDFVYRKAQYDDPRFRQDLRDAEQFIASRNGQVSLDELRQRARALRPNDEFYLDTTFVAEPAAGSVK